MTARNSAGGTLLCSKNLPVRQHKDRIVDKIQLNRVTLIIANTGSGKSSQVPQMLLEEGLMPLLCTQPRRLAVVAISKVVAQERGCLLGEEVGYHIGHKKVISPQSKIVFETTGVLLEELRGEGIKVLSRYKVIILDEVHERSIESDLTLTCIKQFMQRNGNIRLVLMSATFDCELYKEYFKDVDRGERVEIIPVLDTAEDGQSRRFNCKVHYLEDVLALLKRQSANLDSTYAIRPAEKANDLKSELQCLIADLIIYLHQSETDSTKNVLVFLPTYKALEQQWSSLKQSGLDIKIFVLHSSIDMDHSLQAMEVSLPVRKVILATNVAESSVTIPGISYVIDSCSSLEIFWDNERKKCIPRLVRVSKSQADQRRGRTGRTCDGEVFRMVPRGTYQEFATFETPAIQLLSLREQVLTVTCAESKAINDPIVLFSKAMDPPSPLTVQNALDTLRSIEAVSASSQRGKYLPTSYGKLLASLPLSLASAILVVKGGQQGLLRETAVLAALLDSSPFPVVHPFGHEVQYQTYLERYYQRRGSLHAEANSFSYVSVLLANLHAFEFWQCTFKDKQRLERLLKFAGHLTGSEFDESLVEGEDVWCAKHSVSPSALHATAEISATILEKLHVFRPNFLSHLQGPPSYYSAYEFEHTCEIHPDEGNIMGRIILQEDELESDLGFCVKDNYVNSEQFHSQEDINNLRKLIGQVQRDLLQGKNCEDDGEEDEDDSSTDVTTLCRYFQRGVCTKGSNCEYAHDLTARRSLCKYFMTPAGCRYGEMCEFRHAGASQQGPMQDHVVDFEEDPPLAYQFLDLLPPSDQDHILVCEEDDFSFTERLCMYHKPNKVIVTISSSESAVMERQSTAMERQQSYVKERVKRLASMGVKIVWEVSVGSLFLENAGVIPWTVIASVLWAIRREKAEEVVGAKRMLHFFSSMSLSLLTRDVADITILVTMCNDQYAKCQVERIARDCFFFPVQSLPFDMNTFGVYKPAKNRVMAGEPKPVTYVFELLPPSATQHGDYFWLLQQAVEERTKEE